jgi:hypothetical protein
MMSGDWMDEYAFADFCAKLAAELGMELDGNRTWTWCRFLVPYVGDEPVLSGQIQPGLGYSLTRPRGDAMTEISACYPPTNCAFDRAKIGASVARGPHAVAVEIRRRLEPGYLAALAAIAEYDAEEARLQARRASLAGRIRAMFPSGNVSAPGHCQTGDTTRLIICGAGLLGGEIRLSRGGDEVEFERFRVPADVGLTMLTAVAVAVAVTARRRPAASRPGWPVPSERGTAETASASGKPPRPPFPVICPDWPQPGAETPAALMGCGSTDLEGPDDEGWFDCRTCGLYFEPEPPPAGAARILAAPE